MCYSPLWRWLPTSRDSSAPTSQKVGVTVDDTQSLPLSATLPLGRYRVEVGLYNQATGERLPVSTVPGAISLNCGNITIT